MEIWKDIEGYDNYMVSNLGRVKSLKFNKERILKPYKTEKGYLKISLIKNNRTKVFSIHRLVAQAFIPNIENKKEIDHINTVRDDNRVENLRWTNHKENCNNFTTKQNYSKCRFSKLSTLAKCTFQFNNNMELIKKWNCTRDIERELGFSNKNISSCCNGKRKTAYGYKWGYEEDYEQIPFKVFDLKIYKKVS